jgi:ribosomal-protein-alanine N-acetyltransferase
MSAKNVPAAEHNPIIRRLKSSDAQEIAALEGLCPEAAQWGIAGYSGFASGAITGWGAEVGGNLVASIVVRIAADELEILNVAVNPNNRRQGIATKLISEATSSGRKHGARRAFLEVRDSNFAARAFYQALGFQETGRRKDYYPSPAENAIILTLPLT